MALINFNNIRDFFTRKNVNRANTFVFANLDYDTGANLYNTFKDNKQNYSELLKAFNLIPEVYSPLMFRASNSAKVGFKIYELKGEEKIEINNQNDALYKLLSKPNEFAGFNEFKGNIELQRNLFGNAYINSVVADTQNGTIPTKLFLLPPQDVEIKLKSDVTDFRMSEIDKYKVVRKDKGINITIDKDKVLHLKSFNPNFIENNYLYGISPLVSLNLPINSISSAYSAKTKLYTKGANVILTTSSGGANDAFNAPTSEEIEADQKRLDKYGMTEGQNSIMMSKLPLSAQMLGYNIQQLQIPENILADFQAICRNLQVPSILISDNTSATFSNKEVASTQFFEGVFRSNEDSFFNDLTAYFNKFEIWKNRIIEPDYSKVPELQDNLDQLQTYNLTDVERGLITRNEYLTSINRPTNDNKEFDELYTYNNGIWTKLDQNGTENI